MALNSATGSNPASFQAFAAASSGAVKTTLAPRRWSASKAAFSGAGQRIRMSRAGSIAAAQEAHAVNASKASFRIVYSNPNRGRRTRL